MCNFKFFIIALLGLLLLSACSQEPEGDSDQAANIVEEDAATEAETSVPAAYEPPDGTSEAVLRALNHPYRPEADIARDAGRKPAHVLDFFGVEPGMTVLELFGASGYYTELLYRIVGPDGKLIVHNNEAAMAYYPEEIPERFKEGRLFRADRYVAELNDIDVPDESVDLVTMILNYHDVYWVTPPDSENPWPPVDTKTFLANIYRALKPGGVFGVVDHVGADGLSLEGVSDLHRIDPAQVRAEFEAAGFIFDGEADFLLNPDDNLERGVFNPEVRGRTSRFVMRFRKPGAE